MVDAYKCQSCGEVVGRPRSCPSCGETAMRPTRVPESELDDDEPPADDGGSNATGDGDGSGRETVTEQETEGNADTGDQSAADGKRSEPTVTDSGRSGRTGRSGTGSGGLLAWLKSLF